MVDNEHEGGLLSWGLLASVGVMCASVYLVHRFARPDAPLSVRLATLWCWWCTFSILYLLPIDLAPSSRSGRFLFNVWETLYWVSFVLAWTVIPVMWYFYEAGDFTFGARLRSALRSNVRFYAVAGLLLVAFLIYVAVESHMTGGALVGFAICLSNTWGLTLYVLLLGYGLVEVPRALWYEADAEKSLEHCYYRAAETHESMLLAEDDLVTTRNIVRRIARGLPGGYPLRSELAVVEGKLAVLDEIDVSMDGNLSDFSETDLANTLMEAKEPDLALLTRLHAHTTAALRTYFRHRDTLEDLTERGVRLERAAATARRPLPPICAGGGAGGCGAALAVHWSLSWRPLVLRLLACVATVMSGLTIWSQITISAPFLSLWAIAYSSARDSDDATQAVTILPLAYLASCAFFSMFRLKLMDYYVMDPKRRTGEVSLLFNGTYLLRIFAPIGANFVQMVNANDTAFQRVIGSMDVVPFFGGAFTTYLPIGISIFCLCTYFHVYGRVLRFIGIDTFSYGSNDEDKLREGRKLVKAASLAAGPSLEEDSKQMADDTVGDSFL